MAAFLSAVRDRKDCDVAISKTAAHDKQSGLTHSRVEDIMSATGIGLAVSANAVWIGVLGYCILSMI
jgi:hypothetical protein